MGNPIFSDLWRPSHSNPPTTPRMDYIKQLNDIQAKAVQTTEGPVMVIAGPGSGKTRVLTFRIAYLMQKDLAAPWEILALTFTNKAAREMKERISKVVGDRANRVWAGTFHSLFARILRIEAEHIGYPSNFTIYDTDDSKSVLKSILKEMNLDPKVYNVNALYSHISNCKSNLITPKAYEANEELRANDKMNKRPHLYSIYARYVAKCKRSGAMDFDDLLFRTFELLQNHPDIRQKYQQKFKYVLVDEFQDTNFLQYAIVKKLVKYKGGPDNICIVGDDAQSIYAFRGATIENILNFERDFPNAKVYKLEQNYRSTQYIVSAANDVITYNKKQIQKRIWTDKGEGNKIRVIKAMTDNEEGKMVADAIVEQKNRNHYKNSDIAILYRTNAQSRVFEEYLRRYNLPYRVYGGQSFYQRKEVKDLIAYLRLTVNPNDDEALRRAINNPRRGIGGTTMAKLSNLATANQEPIWQVLTKAELPSRTSKNIKDFVTLIKMMRDKAASVDAYEAADYVARQSGLLRMLKADTTVEGQGRLDNVTALLDGIKEFVESDEADATGEVTDKSLSSYLQNIALVTDADNEEDNVPRITLMSTHAAKGLEFPAVFVVGLEENLFPSYMGMQSPEGLDEERRLFYVAITRAEEFLSLSYAGSRYQHGNMRYNEPSRFLEEISGVNIENAHLHQRRKAGVSGSFKPKGGLKVRRSPVKAALPENFTPSPVSAIQPGKSVVHARFGNGTVKSIDGGGDDQIATIAFDSAGEKRLVLRFAKLMVV